MQDEIVNYLREHQEGISSKQLAETFLKFKTPDPRLAHTAVSAILKKDSRCFCNENDLWFALRQATSNQNLIRNVQWTAVYLLVPQNDKKVYYISIWDLATPVTNIFSQWLINPSLLPYSEASDLTNAADTIATCTIEESFLHISALLKNKVPVFFNHLHRSLFNLNLINANLWQLDDSILCGDLLRACAYKVPRPMEFATTIATATGKQTIPNDAYRQGAEFAELISELLDQITQKGLETRDNFERRVLDGLNFSEKKFTLNDILQLPETPGVYGFKNREGNYIYIGKAKNLKRRVMSYFRDSEESPAKLNRLRTFSYDLTTVPCGSELESLLYEFRLIKKYQPELNRQMSILERKGTFKPLRDCIVLLPHADAQMGMSVWYRNEQKILMRPFKADFSESQQIESEIEQFFFSKSLIIDKSDFPEQEIVFRWVRQNQDSLFIIQVEQHSNTAEIVAALKSYWNDLRSQYPALNQ